MICFQKRPKSRDRSKGKGKASKESESTLTLTQMVKKTTGDESGAGDKVGTIIKKFSDLRAFSTGSILFQQALWPGDIDLHFMLQ